ncbi:UDP-glucose 4-epimerase GalE [Micromonospora sp. NPDC018662]|uniref:UDP-glucose 4-epimerase GalE n=1 Tax=Micromonospora sp. NPDC018662 TaxID=3364238 RepID=UPI00378EB6D9
MNVLVVGGAGYIGSVTVRYLRDAGHRVVVLDSLVRGFADVVPRGVRLVRADISELADAVPRDERIDAVVHLAAYAYVGESVPRPEIYWDNNVVRSIKLLNAMRERGIRDIVFASSCAAYGEPVRLPIGEDQPPRPVNAYGMTKLAVDMALASEATAHGLAATSLRFFNAAGGYRDVGERHDPETHLIPTALQAALERRGDLTIHGADYPTRDGTCVRDYIHVLDLARAVELALRRNRPGRHAVYNLGTGTGATNREVVEMVQQVTGRSFAVAYGARRPGDPHTLLAANERARRHLGWEPLCSSLDRIVEDAWRFHRDFRGVVARR